MTTRFKQLFTLALVFFAVALTAQTTTATPAPGQDDEMAKKVDEYKITEVIPTDSLPINELMARAVNWVKLESPRYKKTGGSTTASKAECTVSFPVKPKELNPETDYTGKVTMKVVIECKDNRYKYTISQVKHISKSGKASGGAFENTVPECGSMVMQELTWKKLKGEAVRGAQLVVADIKAGMFKPSAETNTEEW